MFLVHYLVHPAVFGEVGKKGEEVRYHLEGGYLITNDIELMEGPVPSSCSENVTLSINLRLYENTIFRFCCCCKPSTR